MKGTLVEDINYLHRTEEMFDILLPPQRRKTQALMMMGDTEVNRMYEATDAINEIVGPGFGRKVMCPILSGLLSASQAHWIPLKMAPLTIELEINPLLPQYLATGALFSANWALEDAQIKVDLCEVDAFLADRVYQMIRSNGLQFSFASFNTTLNILPGVSAQNGQISTQFAKSYSRVKSIFITFGTAEYAGAQDADRILNETNAFFWPARSVPKGSGGYGDYNPPQDVVEFQLHVGSETMPQYPIRSLAEFAYHLEKALDLTASVEGISISPLEYRTDKFIIGLDVEKAGTGPGGGAEFTGLDTSVGGGSNIRIEMKNLNAFAGSAAEVGPPAVAARTSQVVDRIYLTLVFNAIAVLEERGVTVLD